ncbi:MAG: hypothetical protein ACOX8P_12475 [Tepidanaerobacteraceae bacterium]
MVGIGIILGSLLWVTFFKGVPIGPLTAVAIIAVIIKFIKH